MNGVTRRVKAVVALIAAGTQWLPVAAGDYNGDGLNELLWRDSSGASPETRVMTVASPPTYGTIAAPLADWYVAP